MNTTKLKKFAQAARRKLLEQVGAKMEYVLTQDTAEHRERASDIKSLQEEINKTSKEQVTERVAYIWFNRLMALRFMDANDYQPSGVRIISPLSGESSPQILAEAKRGNFEEEIPVDQKFVLDTLDGKTGSRNTQNEAFRLLLVAGCNALHQQFPFLFEHINDYTELLLPDDLISEFSVVHDMVEGMSKEDCKDVEIIGWLYQFYISERKDELINAKKKYKKNEIAPVTQLFTPKWIVEYMVSNTLGQFWKEARPNTRITDGLEFYISPNNPETIPNREIKSVEDIRFFDPCMGSGHILTYAFDVFYKMYEEEGYNPSKIPELILTKNLYGIDIDDRASQLAAFALMMKGRQYQRRFLRKNVIPHVTAFQNFSNHPKFENAKVLGSLIKFSKKELQNISVEEGSLFAAREEQLIKQATYLANDYDIIVTNPPYLNSGYMEDTLKKFVFTEYKSTKSDMFASFLIQVSRMTKSNGLIGYICPYVWMFIKSYEELRKFIIKNSTITSLVQLEYNAFGPAVVPIATFTLRNEFLENFKGSYVKLSEFKGAENQAPKTKEAILNSDCSWFFNSDQKDFEKIPNNPIGYWLSKKFIHVFEIGERLESKYEKITKGSYTGNNNRFLRLWYEVNSFDENWVKYNKAGGRRKWYGLAKHLISNKEDLKNFSGAGVQPFKYFSKPHFAWGGLTSGAPSFRMEDLNVGFDDVNPSLIATNLDLNQLGLLNSKIVEILLNLLNPTLHYQIGDIKSIPFLDVSSVDTKLVSDNIFISKKEWNSRETSWDFRKNQLICHQKTDLKETYDSYSRFWTIKFHQLHQNEEELNRQFIDIYGLQEELTPDVSFKDITILKIETTIEDEKLVFDSAEVMTQFLSYAVGCMFGRYSLDKEGFILADPGENLEDFYTKVGKGKEGLSFVPDNDNIISVLNDEWFEDDIVGRFNEFLKASFGKASYEKNLTFIEEQLGKSTRNFFVKRFFVDHVNRYKKRPIYWMFSSPKGHFSVLVYLHRYTPDTLSIILNNYLRTFIDKLKARRTHFEQMVISGTNSEQNKAIKEIDKLDKMIQDCEIYERDILYPLAAERIELNLDEGVLVNYNKFGKAVKEVKGLNDKKTKDKVRKFDWIDVTQIRD